MTYRCPPSFGLSWQQTPIVFVDFETTGLPPIGRAVEVGFARFEGGACVESYGSFIDPGCLIPEEATAIHGITNADVEGAPSAALVFEQPQVVRLLQDAQPGAFNSSFDRLFVPVTATLEHSWPWLDALVLARKVDRFVKGANKNKLVPTCERHGIALSTAHRAEHDAKAAGELFFKLMPQQFDDADTLGTVLLWTREEQNREWHRFHQWLFDKQKQEPAP